MAAISVITGLLPNLISQPLSAIFTPSAINLATASQAIGGSIIAWIIGLQYLPAWPVWIAMVAIVYGQMTLKDATMQANEVLIGDGLSGDSVDQRRGANVDQTLVLA